MLYASAASDVGRVRKTNEDAYVADPDAYRGRVLDFLERHLG